jgi:hypothetical protein
MGHFRSNLRDLVFNLFEFLGLDEVLGSGPFAQLDTATAREILAEVERLAVGEFAASFVEGDRTPLRLVDGQVVLPAGIRRSLDAYFAGEWHRLQLPPHLGGFGSPPSLNWACLGMLAGANPAALLYTAGPCFAAIADRFVTPEQRRRWIVPMVERRWGATMAMTEPEAGSDVGAGRTLAVAAGDAVWHLRGVKRFITNADFDWPENIVHLVLARPEGAGPGTKGLSLFLVPKYWVNPDGSLGERNGVALTRLEDKMGLNASATGELTFGQRRPARGVLVGEVHDGIKQMFRLVEYSRMLVGVKAIETLSTGYLNALAYARERVQGPDLARAGDPTAPRVAIVRHPDVRRMLLAQKSHAEGLRALALYTASLQDRIELDPGDGDLRRRNALLLPLVKGYGSEKSYELLALSLQVLGGSGYCRDHPFEQYLRDAKIDTLYEGTTGIQGLDLFFRKIVRDRGASLSALLAEVQSTAKGDRGNGALLGERALLGRALEDVQGMVQAMAGFLPGPGDGDGQASMYRAGLHTTTLLFSLAELLIGWLLLGQAEVALHALERAPAPRERAFYEGKVASARFFAATVLPLLSARRAVVEAGDDVAMTMPDAAF